MDYIATPLTQSCQTKLQECSHVCVGISPFNGYFHTQRIASLIRWAFETYPEAHFFIPDEAPAYTFQALGYTPEKARQKARKQAKCVINRVRAGLEEYGRYDDSLIITAEALRQRPRYVELAAKARELFATDKLLHDATMTTSEWVLSGYLPAGAVATAEQKQLAVQYFLDELPMFVDTPGILGITNSTFVYHQNVPFLERFYDGEFNWEAAPGQSFTVLQPVEELVAVS